MSLSVNVGQAEVMRVTGVASEDKEHIAELFRTERRGLLRLGVLLTGDRVMAEDLVQDAFFALQRRWGALADPAAAAGYLRVSVVNGARSLYRRRDVARRYLRVAEPKSLPSADTDLLLAEEHRAVAAAVRRLPRRQQQVLVLRYWSDLTEIQIATTLGVSVGTVKSSASRALTALERQLGVQDDH